jgi:hypothetical protein
MEIFWFHSQQNYSFILKFNYILHYFIFLNLTWFEFYWDTDFKKKSFCYSFLTNGPRRRERRGSESPVPQPLPTKGRQAF